MATRAGLQVRFYQTPTRPPAGTATAFSGIDGVRDFIAVDANNRLRGLNGAAKAAEGAGQQEKARTYFRKLAELTNEADADREEIRETKAFLAPRTGVSKRPVNPPLCGL